MLATNSRQSDYYGNVTLPGTIITEEEDYCAEPIPSNVIESRWPATSLHKQEAADSRIGRSSKSEARGVRSWSSAAAAVEPSVRLKTYDSASLCGEFRATARAGDHLSKVVLPSAHCVEMSQRFRASSGDQLALDYIVLLDPRKSRSSDCVSAAIELWHLEAKTMKELVCKVAPGKDTSCPGIVYSGPWKSVFCDLTETGLYELRFIVCIDTASPRAFVNLQVDNARLILHSSSCDTPLADVGCVGRVA